MSTTENLRLIPGNDCLEDHAHPMNSLSPHPVGRLRRLWRLDSEMILCVGLALANVGFVFGLLVAVLLLSHRG